MSINFSSLVVYRGNFLNNLFSNVAWGFFSLFSIVLLTYNTPAVFGWKREELWLLNGLYGLIIGFFHMFISNNMYHLSQVIHEGELDFVLVKPVDSQFAVSFWRINYAGIARVLMSLAYVFFVVQQLHIRFSALHVIGFLFLVPLALLLLYSLWFLVTTTMIWFTRTSNIIDLLFTVTGISRYPRELSQQLVSYIFFFLLPFTFVINVPAKLLLQRLTLVDVGGLFIFALLLFLASRKFWKFALRYYTSASS